MISYSVLEQPLYKRLFYSYLSATFWVLCSPLSVADPECFFNQLIQSQQSVTALLPSLLSALITSFQQFLSSIDILQRSNILLWTFLLCFFPVSCGSGVTIRTAHNEPELLFKLCKEKGLCVKVTNLLSYLFYTFFWLIFGEIVFISDKSNGLITSLIRVDSFTLKQLRSK